MIQAIVVSVNYSDFLRHTLPLLTARVDKVFVVTSPEDSDTERVASKYKNTYVVPTRSFTAGSSAFRKGAAINAGLACMDRTGWFLHLDADIALMDDIPLETLDESVLWSVPRIGIRGMEEWQKRQTGEEVGRDMTHELYRGGELVPPGYFQLWHASQWRLYPDVSANAAWDDITFSRSFRRRAVIEGLRAFHLESEDHKLAANWHGRKTQVFA